ncbi:MAG TPA: four helix bundle protein [Thermoanaerobaculia bacterium]
MKDKDGLVPLRQRTTSFSLRVIRMYSGLPKSRVADTVGLQALRAGTSVGGQYREACRARSDAELISKLESALQELDETSYWLELLVGGEIVKEKRLAPLMKEADELTAILVTAVRKIKARRKR